LDERAGRKFVEHVKASGQEITLLLRDRDVIYGQGFDKTIREAGIRVKKNSVRAPNLQAHVERFVQSFQHEALDHFIVFGEEHFDHLVSQYVEHYHTERPHQAKGNVPLEGEWPEQEGDPPDPATIVCRTRLGGLLKHYERRAA
jgi:putative transposase